MLNEKVENISYDNEIERLRSTLIGRLNLLNYFNRFLKIEGELTINNIDVDISNKDEITKYLLKSFKYVEKVLGPQVFDYVIKNGTMWEKGRIQKIIAKN